MIACLGWGSLVWDLDGLPVEKLGGDVPVPLWTRCAEGEVGDWKPDGPTVTVEFVRQSQNGRLTLALYAAAEPVPSLWARMTVDTMKAAVEALATREGSKSNGKRKPLSKPERDIGCWSRGQADPKDIPGLGVWAIGQDIEHVIWTALGPKFCNLPVAPTEDQAVAYLRKLSKKAEDEDTDKAKEKYADAKKYVRQTPQQIDTAYRRCIVRCLGPAWKIDREC